MWNPTTDDDFPYPDVATETLEAMREWSAGQADMSGFADEEGTDRLWTVTVADTPAGAVAIHVDWRTQQVITAWAVPPKEKT